MESKNGCLIKERDRCLVERDYLSLSGLYSTLKVNSRICTMKREFMQVYLVRK